MPVVLNARADSSELLYRAMEDALYDVESMRHFAGLSIDEGFIPDESTILTRISHEVFQFAIGSRFFLDFSGRVGNSEESGFVFVKTDAI